MSQRGENVFTEHVAVLDAQAEFPLRGRVVDHMEHEAEKSVDEILPSSVFPLQATHQQFAIQFGNRHFFIVFCGLAPCVYVKDGIVIMGIVSIPGNSVKSNSGKTAFPLAF